MNPDPSISVSCRIIAEFTDDASEFDQTEPEYVPIPRIPAPPAPTPHTAEEAARPEPQG